MHFGLIRPRHQRELQKVPRVNEEIVALLEPGIEVEGKIKVSSGMARFNCHFKGEISSAGTIVVADQGELEADIQAKQISIAGKVKGTVHALEHLEIKEHGVLLGDVETPSLAIDPGAYFGGHCQMPTLVSDKPVTSEVDSKELP